MDEIHAYIYSYNQHILRVIFQISRWLVCILQSRGYVAALLLEWYLKFCTWLKDLISFQENFIDS